MWDLTSLYPCIGRGSLNHRTTGKFLYLFLRTAVTKNHELGSLDDRKVWSCNSQAGRPRPWVWAGLVPSAAVQAPEAFLAGLSMGVFALVHVVGYIGSYDALTLLLCFLQYLPAGYCLAWCYSNTGTIVTPILMHMIVNAYGMYNMR